MQEAMQEGAGPVPPAEGDRRREEFRLREYEAVRREMATYLEEVWRIEKFALGGAAALIAWLAMHPVSQPLAWWLPFGFLLVCALRFLSAMYHLLGRSARYLRGIEAEYLPGEGGYETWFRKRRCNQTVAHAAVWVGVLLLALGVALWQPRAQPGPGRTADPHARLR
jgi:hypothetical protein